MPVIFDMTPEEGILLLRFEGALSTKEVVGTAEVASAYVRGTDRRFVIIDASTQVINVDDRTTRVYWTGGLKQFPDACRISYVPPISMPASRARIIKDTANQLGHAIRFFDCIDAATAWIRFEHDRPGKNAA